MLATALVATGFSYDPGLPRAPDHARWSRSSAGSATSAASAPPPSTCASWRAGASTPTTSGAWRPGTSAAGELIAREAGAVITGFDGAAPEPGAVVAAAPGIHAALLELLAAAGA